MADLKRLFRNRRPRPRPVPSGAGGERRLIQQSDITYVGAFKIDLTVTYERPVGLAVRWVSGSKRLMIVDIQGFKLVELAVPALVAPAWPSPGASALNACTLVKRWTDSPLGSAALTFAGGGGNLWGLGWDETDKRLYWLVASSYDTDSDPIATLGWATIDDGGDVLTPGNRVALTSPTVPQKTIQGGVLNIPQAFADAYVSGKRLGIGYGGYRSVAGQGSIASYGPTLYAIDPPAGSPADNDTRPGGPCLLRRSAGFGEPRPLRPAFAGTGNDFLFTGSFTGEDPTTYGAATQHEQAMIWIDDGQKYGVIHANSFCGGNMLAVIQSGTTSTSLVLDTVGDAHAGEAVQIQYGGTIGDGNPTERAIATIASVSGSVITLTAPAVDNGTPVTGMVGGFARTGSFYQNSYLAVGEWVAHGWMVYDPADLAAVALGSKQPYEISFVDSWSQPAPNIPLPTTDGQYDRGSAGGPVTPAMAYDPVEKRIYVYWLTLGYTSGTAGPYPLVFVYQVG